MLVTVKSKAVRFVVTVSSVTEMTMLEVMPTSKFVSVPVRAPVEVSKLAQLGLLVILNVRLSPASTSEVVGVKL